MTCKSTGFYLVHQIYPESSSKLSSTVSEAIEWHPPVVIANAAGIWPYCSPCTSNYGAQNERRWMIVSVSGILLRGVMSLKIFFLLSGFLQE